MNLYEATKDLHHACERHSLGGRMSKGNITPQEWADWLWAFRCLHNVVDTNLPAHMSRDLSFAADLSALPQARPSSAALTFAASLTGQDTAGAAYVLHGAHRSGGRVMGPILTKRGLPCAHISYKEPEEVQTWIRSVRECEGSTELARKTFQCLLSVMDEIEASSN